MNESVWLLGDKSSRAASRWHPIRHNVAEKHSDRLKQPQAIVCFFLCDPRQLVDPLVLHPAVMSNAPCTSSVEPGDQVSLSELD
jgi:hypothetical protein